MHITQRDGQQPLDTEQVWYDGTVELLPGYAVCYDHTVATADGADGWNEKVRGRVVTKPLTANLPFFAGIVIDPPRKNGDATGQFKGWCTIAKMRHGTWLNARTNSNLTAGNFLRLANDNFSLVVEATAGTKTVNTVGVCGATVDTSSTAANSLVMGAM